MAGDQHPSGTVGAPRHALPMNEIKHKTSVTVETVDGTYHFDLARIKAHVDGLPDLTFKMDNGRGDRVSGGKFDADAVGLSVQIDGGVLAVCAIVEGPIGDDGSQIAEVQPVEGAAVEHLDLAATTLLGGGRRGCARWNSQPPAVPKVSCNRHCR